MKEGILNMKRGTWAEINLNNIKHNFHSLKNKHLQTVTLDISQQIHLLTGDMQVQPPPAKHCAKRTHHRHVRMCHLPECTDLPHPACPIRI